MILTISPLLAVLHVTRGIYHPAGEVLPQLVGLLGLAVAAAAALIVYSRTRPITPDGQSRLSLTSRTSQAALLLLITLVTIGAGTVGVGLPTWLVPTILANALLLCSPILILGSALTLPRAVLAPEHRWRVLVDGLMITIFAATFVWALSLGPGLLLHWRSVPNEISALGYPASDVLLIAALLILSAKSSRLPGRVWWSLPAGLAALILADCVRQYGIQTGTGTAGSIAEFVRLGAEILVGVAVVALVEIGAQRSERSRPGGFISGHAEQDLLEGPSRIWDALLPSALVPASVALAIFDWQKGHYPEVTSGILAGTVMLVCLAFIRQLMAYRENARLYAQVQTAYRESLAQAVNTRALNDELKRTKDQLQANNEVLSRTNLNLQTQATTDPLTGLPNHRSMVLALDQELDRSLRYSRPCSLLFLDLDHFKALNDSCGHLAGDTVLREMVTPIVQSLRAADIAGRWGGEEFIVLLPETDIEDALQTGERLRELVSQYRFTVGGGGHITCSIGVASYPLDANSRDELIESADRAMYAAKRLGRNQVRAAVDPSATRFLSEIRKGYSREETTLWGVVQALTTIVKAHDTVEDAQSQEVANLSMRVASCLGLAASEVRIIGLAARLHDVGMVSVPQAVLNKPSEFDSSDWAAVMPHTEVGAEVVGSVPSLAVLAPLIRAHHERWDGTGYPDGLEGDEIPIGARIISACAAFTAMTTPGHRTEPRSTDAALEELITCSGSQFDPQVVSAIEQVLLEQSAAPLLQAV